MMALTGKKLEIVNAMKAGIKVAGFTNVQEKWYKVPLGDWAKNPILKEAGQFCKEQMLQGMEGFISKCTDISVTVFQAANSLKSTR